MCIVISIERESEYTDPQEPKRIKSNALANLSLQPHDQIHVVIQDGITEIGYEAFKGCKNLISVVFPDSVTGIGTRAFYGCGLTSVYIPHGVRQIGYRAFSNCTSLNSVAIADGLTAIGKGIFSGCSSLTTVEIPESVNSIEAGAFSGCSQLTNIIIPRNNVIRFGHGAFTDCDEPLIHAIFPAYYNRIYNMPNILEERWKELVYPVNCDEILNRMVNYISDHYYALFNQERPYMWPMSDGATVDGLEKKTKDEEATIYEFGAYSYNLRNAHTQQEIEQSVFDILVWGGFRDWNKPAPADYVHAITNILQNVRQDYRFLIEQGRRDYNYRISFWSKILSAYKPGTFFIYDARVALALSYITLQLPLNSPCFWKIAGETTILNKHFSDRNLMVPNNDHPTVRDVTNFRRGGADSSSIPVCYDLYCRLLDRLAMNNVIQNRYDDLSDDIKTAYNCVFGFEPNEMIRKRMAIKAHLEKMLFMMKEEIIQEH
jgi:hypothetical protein